MPKRNHFLVTNNTQVVFFFTLNKRIKNVSILQPTSKDESIMRMAIAEAKAAINKGKVGVAALLVWRGEILAVGYNEYEDTRDMTAHREMAILRQAARRIDRMNTKEKADLSIYTTLEPCLMCLCAISFVGIRRVVYSALAEDANEEEMIAKGINCEGINPLLTKGPLELVPGVQREEGKALLMRMNKNS
jgi:tRNA(adenine34) deaminase